MINAGDTLYAARDILNDDIFLDGDNEVCYEKGTPGIVTQVEDRGYHDDGLFEDCGFCFHVEFDYGTDVLDFSDHTWRFSNLSLFTKVKPE